MLGSIISLNTFQNFIYYQPGNGKIKVKEPMEMANKAITQLTEALAAADAS